MSSDLVSALLWWWQSPATSVFPCHYASHCIPSSAILGKSCRLCRNNANVFVFNQVYVFVMNCNRQDDFSYSSGLYVLACRYLQILLVECVWEVKLSLALLEGGFRAALRLRRN